MSIRSALPLLVVFALAAALMVALYAPLTSPHPYPYDGADYMYAGTRGFWANYVDAGSLPLWEFIARGLELRRHPEKRAEISKSARSADDINTYRHFHGPLYAYWIALWSKLGVSEEATYRNVGLAAHIATSLMMMLAYLTLFPSWPRLPGLLTGILFLFNRTALVTAVEITQHIAFLFTAVLVLWMIGLFARNLETRWWYATMASLALAFAAVETASLLVITLAVTLIVLYPEIREKWPDWRQQVLLLAKGIGVWVAVLFAIWPAGIFKLSVVRGFLFLAYMAVDRKTFSPQGPIDLWRMKFSAAPWEHGFLFAGFIAAVILWRRFEHRREALPWLLFSAVFLLVTLKVTLEYTHYRGSIAAAWTMCTGMALGYLWKHLRMAGRVALAAVYGVCVTAAAVAYYQEAAVRFVEEPPATGVLTYVRQANVPRDTTLYLPFFFVPIVHFYHPATQMLGYDADWPLSRLVGELHSGAAYREFLCPQRTCAAVESALGRGELPKRRIANDYNGQPLYVMSTGR